MSILDSFFDLIMGLFYEIENLVGYIPQLSIFEGVNFSDYNEFSDVLNNVYNWFNYFLPTDIICLIIAFNCGLNAYMLNSSIMYKFKHETPFI